MKKLLLLGISLVLFTGKGMAQNVNLQLSKQELKREMEWNAPQLYKSYKTGSTLSGIGMGLTLGGVVAAIIGIATAEKETEKKGGTTTVHLSGSGGGIAAAGFVCALAGTPLWIIGGTKKKNARNRYIRDYTYEIDASQKPSPHLQINAARNGVGLAYVF